MSTIKQSEPAPSKINYISAETDPRRSMAARDAAAALAARQVAVPVSPEQDRVQFERWFSSTQFKGSAHAAAWMTWQAQSARYATPPPCPECQAREGGTKAIARYQGRPARSVVCAANKYGDLVFTGVRHFCLVMVGNMAGHDIPALRKERGEIQGFIDQHGVFMDRKEAAIVARESGQLARYEDVFPEVLFSEDIY